MVASILPGKVKSMRSSVGICFLVGALVLMGGCAASRVPAPGSAVRVSLAGPSGPVPLAPVPTDRARVEGRDSRLGCTWVRSSGTVHVGDQNTLEQLRANAVERARGTALRTLFGSSVRSRFLDFQEEGFRGKNKGSHMVESLVKTTRQGRILSESLLSRGYMGVPGCADCLFHVVLRDCIAPLSGGPDAFSVRVEVRPRTHFTPGDEARIRVRMTGGVGRVWIYLYDIEADGTVAAIVPNAYTGNPVALISGALFEYPDRTLRRAGVHLTAQLPPGPDQRVSVETIRVIATRKPLPPGWEVPDKGGYWGIVGHLSASDISWMDDAAYFVVERPTVPGANRTDREMESSH